MLLQILTLIASATLYFVSLADTHHDCPATDPTGVQDSSAGLACLYAKLQPGDELIFGNVTFLNAAETEYTATPATYQASWLNARHLELHGCAACEAFNFQSRAPHGVVYRGHGSTLRLPDSGDWTDRKQDKILWIDGGGDSTTIATQVLDLNFDGNRCGQSGWLSYNQIDVCGAGSAAPSCLTGSSAHATCPADAVCYGENPALGIPGICYTETQFANLFISGGLAGDATATVVVRNVESYNSTLSGIFTYGAHLNTTVENSFTHDNLHGITVARFPQEATLLNHQSSTEHQSIHVESQQVGSSLCGDILDDDETLAVSVLGGTLGHVSWGVPDGRGSHLELENVNAESFLANACYADVAIRNSNFTEDVTLAHLGGDVNVEFTSVGGSLTAHAVADGEVLLNNMDIDGNLNWCIGGGCNIPGGGTASLDLQYIRAGGLIAHPRDTTITDTVGLYEGRVVLRHVRNPVTFNTTLFEDVVDLGGMAAATEAWFSNARFRGHSGAGSYALLLRGSGPMTGAPPEVHLNGVFADAVPAPLRLFYASAFHGVVHARHQTLQASAVHTSYLGYANGTSSVDVVAECDPTAAANVTTWTASNIDNVCD